MAKKKQVNKPLVPWTYYSTRGILLDANQIGEIALENSYIGFTYVITHKLTHKFYVGTKLFLFKKGRKYVESDWRTYTGSSNDLNADIAKDGLDSFMFEILSFSQTKAQKNYDELKHQIRSGCMEEGNNSYNGIIRIRLGKPKGGVKHAIRL